MKKILKSFDSYGDFVEVNYFINAFKCIPSIVKLDLPLVANKENIEKVLQEIDIKASQLELVFKNWKTSKNKHAKDAEDFPYHYFYKSAVKKLCIFISLENEILYIQYLYDHNDLELEQWITTSFRKIRNKLGKPQSPIFKVLSKSSHGFYAEEVNIENFEIEIENNYNDDFKEVDAIINKSLETEMSGLILLHGPPGTGKTSYIKNLLSIHKEQSFIFIPNDFVNELLQPDFISFLILNKNSILVIEDAEKVITSRETENKNSVVSTILQLTDGLFSDYLNIKVICTFNTSIDKIDKALLRKGRMIAFYEFKALAIEKTNAILHSLGFKNADKALTIAEIFNYNEKDFSDGYKKNPIGFK